MGTKLYKEKMDNGDFDSGSSSGNMYCILTKY